LVDLSVPLALDASTTARFSRSARICFSIADSTSLGGAMFLISYRITFTPHATDALSSSATTFALMVPRLRTSIELNLAISLRSVVWASWAIAKL